MECSVCYCYQATCKLVCGHSFCKTCVKTWYQKSEEPTCPMCRHPLYFKGLHKLLSIWEDEKTDKRNEEAFNTAFESIFDEESDDDYTVEEEDESDSEWEEWEDSGDEEEEEDERTPRLTITKPSVDFYSKFILEEIIELQKEYQKAMDIGMDFEYYLDNMDDITIENSSYYYSEDDVFPHFKKLFVSNHIIRNNRRTGSRVPSKCDNSFTLVVLIECL